MGIPTSTVDVYLDGELIGESGITYGYEDQYLLTGMEIAMANTYLPRFVEGRDARWQWAERNGVTIVTGVTDVRRKRDL